MLYHYIIAIQSISAVRAHFFMTPFKFKSANFLFACLLLVMMAVPTAANSQRVVVSIKPLHSLVSGVMAGIGQPTLVIDGAASPHSYSLKPSQAGMLQDARLIFWIGPSLEVFLEKPLETIAERASSVALLDAPGLTLLPYREDEAFRGGTDHHDSEDDHGNEAIDPHIWLDPQNAKILVTAIADALAGIDPTNGDAYRSNAASMQIRLDRLTTEITSELASLKGRGFVVFHDGYHYFEQRFGMEARGALTINPEIAPGAAQIRDIRQAMERTSTSCIFTEPQFDPKLALLVREGTNARVAALDPLGFDLAAGPDLYFILIRNMAKAFQTCLGD
jgi:zinc transport system substrate-binding protein